MAAGALIRSIPAPASAANGIAWDGRTFWIVDGGTDEIYQICPLNGAVVKSFDVPAASTSGKGLTWDPSTSTLWLIDSNSDEVYQIDTKGSLLRTLAAPASANAGIDHSGSHLYLLGNTPDAYYVLDPDTGVILLDQATVFDPAPTGIAAHKGFIWVTGNNTNTIYQITLTGFTISTFPSPTNNSQDLVFTGRSMWILGTDTVFQVSLS